jgi:hypothetical protein
MKPPTGIIQRRGGWRPSKTVAIPIACKSARQLARVAALWSFCRHADGLPPAVEMLCRRRDRALFPDPPLRIRAKISAFHN